MADVGRASPRRVQRQPVGSFRRRAGPKNQTQAEVINLGRSRWQRPSDGHLCREREQTDQAAFTVSVLAVGLWLVAVC